MGGFARAFLRPAFVFILVAAIVALLIVGIGQLLLALHPELGEHEVTGFASTVQEFIRPDLLTALGLSLVVLFGGAILSRPRGEPRKLDEPVAVGDRPFFAPVAPPPTDEEMTRRGPRGTWADIEPGFTLYARNGALAKVVALLPGEDEYGKSRRGILYASGLSTRRPAPRSWRPRATRSSTLAGTCRRRASAAVRVCTRRCHRSDERHRGIR
jgi:hypothetical protein